MKILLQFKKKRISGRKN